MAPLMRALGCANFFGALLIVLVYYRVPGKNTIGEVDGDNGIYTVSVRITRRKVVIVIAAALLVTTLFYIEHPSVRALKSTASFIGLIDSQHTLVGLTDVRSIDHVRGNPDASVVLLEYSDFGCVLCAAMQDNFERIIREQKILLVSRHLYARAEGSSFERAVAAECVAKHAGEEAYFVFSRYLYDNQHSIDDATDLSAKVAEFGVSVLDFQDCTEHDARVRERILRDNEEGWRLGARGTPYIIVLYNGRPVGISYANEYGKFTERIKLLIMKARG